MIATETYEITLPKKVAVPLAKRAKHCKSTIPELIIRIIEEHEGRIDDPFYRGENWRHVTESIEEFYDPSKKEIVKTMAELEAMANG